MFLCRIICVMMSVSLLHRTMMGPAAAQDQAPPPGTLTVRSDPSGLSVYVDEIPIGLTPVEPYALMAGIHTVRITHPHRTDWDARDWEREIVVTAGDTIRVHARFMGDVNVLSVPFGADVFINGMHAGNTPIRLPDLSPGIHRISIRKYGYRDEERSVVVRDTTRQVVKVALNPVAQEVRAGMSVRPQNRRGEKILGYATLGLGVVFSGLALHASHRADTAYERYLATADPVRLERFFQQADRYDVRTSRYVVAAQVNFTAAFYFFLSRVLRSDSDHTDRNHK